MTEKTLTEARNKLSGFIRQRRIELGCTQQEIADKTGLSRKTINAIEAGKFWPGTKQFLLISNALETKIILEKKIFCP